MLRDFGRSLSRRDDNRFFAWKWDIKAAAGIGPFLSAFSSS
jgi:hypothetical protein